MMSSAEELAAMRARIVALEQALRAARAAADTEHRAAELAKESAARAWKVAFHQRPDVPNP